MDSIAFDPNMLAAPFVLICLFMAAIAWFAMLVWSLRLSLSMTMKEAPGYLPCFIMLILIIAGNLSVAIGMYVAMGPQPWYIVGAYQSVVQILLMMIVARTNPFSAFFASLCHTVFSSMGTVAIALVFVLFCGSALNGSKERKRQANSYKTHQKSSGGWFGGGGSESSWLKRSKVRNVRYTDNPFTH